MTKASLLEALASFPDDAPVAVSIGLGPYTEESFSWVGGAAVVWSVASNPDVIVLEL